MKKIIILFFVYFVIIGIIFIVSFYLRKTSVHQVEKDNNAIDQLTIESYANIMSFLDEEALHANNTRANI